MPRSWQLCTDDPDERRAFPDLETVLALPSTPAGPPNRLRQVVRVEIDGRAYFLKQFRRTQTKNRVRFRLTAPRAADDAGRELRVTEALRARGFAAPRPIAYGRDGAASYYLCAELEGKPLAALLAEGTATAALADAVARHCGRLLAAGFRLPDLSADHVFVHDGTLAVLDLHNGGVAAEGPAPRRLLGRVLRRFARSVRALPIARRAAMRFAVRLLRAAGASPEQRRELVTAAQPFGTAARYEQGGRSAAYAERNPARTRAELELLRRVWPGRPGETVLDLPCGAGRLLPFLHEHGHRVAQADGAFAMVREARARGHAAGLAVQADALATPFADRAVDGVVSFRFLHHLPPDAAQKALGEACRTARRFVVVSFFHPCSAHHLRRRWRQLLGAPPTRFATTYGRLCAAMAAHGFAPVARVAQRPFVRDLWVAAFVRR